MKKISLSVMLLSVLLAACSPATPTPGPSDVPVVIDDFSVTAEGRLEPETYANISFSVGGNIAEVLVTEGESVAAGDVLARLENTEALQAEVARAKAEVISAGQALDDLYDKAELAAAQAQADVARARESLDKAQRHLNGMENPDLEYYRDQLNDAQEALQTAQENIEATEIGSLRASLQAARDAAKTAEERLGKVKAAIDGCSTCDPKRAVTVDGFPQTLADAQDLYNDTLNAVRELEIRLAQAERGNSNALNAAQDRLEDALEDLQFAEGSPNALKLAVAQADVALAQAKLADAEAYLAKIQPGPDPDKVALAEARLATAKAALAAANAALENAELRAPFAGMVASLKLKVGEQVAPGQPVATLAGAQGWVVKTDNLTEIEVVRVEEGQAVTVVLDSLPEATLNGTVEHIAGVFEEKRGDITYTVTVRLTDSHPQMRWGMTAVATFEK